MFSREFRTFRTTGGPQFIDSPGIENGGLTALVLQYDFLKGINRMQVETTRKRFTVEEYHRLAEVGILGPEDRTELIDGAIIQMTPIGGRHLSTVARITELFILAFHGKAITRTKGPCGSPDSPNHSRTLCYSKLARTSTVSAMQVRLMFSSWSKYPIPAFAMTAT